MSTINLESQKDTRHVPKKRGYSLIARVANLRSASISLLIHAIVIILGGSVVLISATPKKADFVAGDGELVMPDDNMAIVPPDPPAPNELPQYSAPAALAPAPVAALTTTSQQLFQVSVAPTILKVNSKLTGLSPTSKAIAGLGGVGGAGGGVKGGTNRSVFGMKDPVRGAGLVGAFYDAKQTRDRMPTGVDMKQFSTIISKFVEGGWQETALNEYYKAPTALYNTQIFIPSMPAGEGPKAFDVGKDVQPGRWLVHYRGKVTPPKDGDFRFVGAGDDYLVVRFNGKVVLDHGFAKATKWAAEKYYDYGWTSVPNGFACGDKFRALAGQFYDIDVLISERPGGRVFFCLLIEDQNAEYQKDAKGNPILPVFRLADEPAPESEKGRALPPHQPTGPIWKSGAPNRSSPGQMLSAK